MKQKLTIALDQEKIKQMEVLLKNEEFRSKSHLIEYLLNSLAD